jgi:hypothetical protein
MEKHFGKKISELLDVGDDNASKDCGEEQCGPHGAHSQNAAYHFHRAVDQDILVSNGRPQKLLLKNLLDRITRQHDQCKSCCDSQANLSQRRAYI